VCWQAANGTRHIAAVQRLLVLSLAFTTPCFSEEIS